MQFSEYITKHIRIDMHQIANNLMKAKIEEYSLYSRELWDTKEERDAYNPRNVMWSSLSINEFIEEFSKGVICGNATYRQDEDLELWRKYYDKNKAYYLDEIEREEENVFFVNLIMKNGFLTEENIKEIKINNWYHEKDNHTDASYIRNVHLGMGSSNISIGFSPSFDNVWNDNIIFAEQFAQTIDGEYPDLFCGLEQVAYGQDSHTRLDYQNYFGDLETQQRILEFSLRNKIYKIENHEDFKLYLNGYVK